MTYQIDQSGKIEQTERHSIISCVNELNLTIFLSKKEKRLIQKIFREAGYIYFFPYFTFSAMVALLISKARLTKKMILDREYFGHEERIKNQVTQYLKLLGVKESPTIVFGHVGKLSKAHQSAYEVAMKKNKSTYITNAKEILSLVFGIKKDRVGSRLTQEWVPGDRRSSRSKVRIHPKKKFVKKKNYA